MTIDHRATSPLTTRQMRQFASLKPDVKAMRAMLDDLMLRLAVVEGLRPRVHVPYAHGHPTGNYHVPSWESGACNRLSKNSEIREFTEHDAAKLLDRCTFCRGW